MSAVARLEELVARFAVSGSVCGAVFWPPTPHSTRAGHDDVLCVDGGWRAVEAVVAGLVARPEDTQGVVDPQALQVCRKASTVLRPSTWGLRSTGAGAGALQTSGSGSLASFRTRSTSSSSSSSSLLGLFECGSAWRRSERAWFHLDSVNHFCDQICRSDEVLMASSAGAEEADDLVASFIPARRTCF